MDIFREIHDAISGAAWDGVLTIGTTVGVEHKAHSRHVLVGAYLPTTYLARPRNTISLPLMPPWNTPNYQCSLTQAHRQQSQLFARRLLRGCRLGSDSLPILDEARPLISRLSSRFTAALIPSLRSDPQVVATGFLRRGWPGDAGCLLIAFA